MTGKATYSSGLLDGHDIFLIFSFANDSQSVDCENLFSSLLNAKKGHKRVNLNLLYLLCLQSLFDFSVKFLDWEGNLYMFLLAMISF